MTPWSLRPCRGLFPSLALGVVACAILMGLPARPLGAQPGNPERGAAPAAAVDAVAEKHLRGFRWRFLGSTGPVRALAADGAFPYRIYVSQAAVGTVRVPHLTDMAGIPPRAWEPTVGTAGGGVAPHPLDAEVVFGTGPGGWIERRDHITGERRRVTVWPREGVYRYARTPPLFFSPHDETVLYAAGNLIFMTEDEGASWRAISPDLTARKGGVLLTAAESPAQAGIFWAGANDGRVVRSNDYGATWKVVTPAPSPPGAVVTAVTPDPHNAAGAYAVLAAQGEAALFRTRDDGVTWESLNAPPGASVNALLADPQRPGLLYAGGDGGVHLSFDQGRSWVALGSPAPVTALLLHGGDLVVGTADRGVWVVDDIGPLAQLRREIRDRDLYLFTPRAVHRLDQSPGPTPAGWGENPPPGVALDLLLGEGVDPAAVEFQILDGAGGVIRDLELPADGEPGHRRLWWDLRYPGAPPHMPQGPRVAPGNYLVRLAAGENSTTAQLAVLPDPRLPTAPEATAEQVELLLTLRDQLRRGQAARAAEPTDDSEALETILSGLAQLAESVAVGQERPTAQARAVHEEWSAALAAVLEKQGEP